MSVLNKIEELRYNNIFSVEDIDFLSGFYFLNSDRLDQLDDLICFASPRFLGFCIAKWFNHDHSKGEVFLDKCKKCKKNPATETNMLCWECNFLVERG
jgi:hypothetical protein